MGEMRAGSVGDDHRLAADPHAPVEPDEPLHAPGKAWVELGSTLLLKRHRPDAHYATRA